MTIFWNPFSEDNKIGTIYMYVRRKVFSWAIDPWDGEEKLFSTNEVEGEKKGLTKKQKIALGLAGTAAATGAGLYAAKKGYLGKRVQGGLNEKLISLGVKVINCKGGSRDNLGSRLIKMGLSK